MIYFKDQSQEKILNSDLYKSTIFVISSPQEAAALAILASENTLYHCIVTTYKGYTDKNYPQIIESIIKPLEIKNLYYLNLIFHPISVSRGSIIRSFIDIILNKISIFNFNVRYYNGRLYKGYFNFVAQKDNPLVTLSNLTEDKISLIEHTPVDSTRRISKMKGIKLSGISSINSIGFRVKVKFINCCISMLYPMTDKFQYSKNGYSWVDNGDNFFILDYRKVQAKLNLKNLSDLFASESKTLFLIDHPDMFKDVSSVREQVEKINFIQMYQQMLLSHADPGEVIICKFHPYITQNSNKAKIFEYVNNIKHAFLVFGYKKVFFLHEILGKDLHKADWPIEMLIDALRVNKIIGVYSSTMIITQNWSGIRVISDCSYLEYFRLARERDAKIFELRFECHPQFINKIS